MSKVFINFGTTRIKVSNIKNYGIADEPCYYAKVYVEKSKEETYRTLFRKREKTHTAHYWEPTNDYKVRINKEEYDSVMGERNVGRYVLVSTDEKIVSLAA